MQGGGSSVVEWNARQGERSVDEPLKPGSKSLAARVAITHIVGGMSDAAPRGR